MSLYDNVIEEVCYQYALEHYAKRFEKSIDDEHVVVNARSNWFIFENDARSFIRKYRNAVDSLLQE